MLKGQRIRFKPSRKQVELLNQCFGSARFVYNHCVAKFNEKEKYDTTTKLKQDYEWLKDSPIPSNSISQIKLDFDKGKSRYFALCKKLGFATKKHRPKFKSKYSTYQSFRNCMPMPNKTMNNRKYQISKKQGFIKLLKELRYDTTSVRNWTISKENNAYYITLLFDVEHTETVPKTNKTIGIDLGIKDFVITSNGEKYSPDNLDKCEKEIIKEQRKLSRKVKNSNNFLKQKSKLNKNHKKLKNIREDFQHKLSKKLINENQVISLETLRPSNMIRNRKLARAIARCSWSKFVEKLLYKANWYDRTIVQVGQFYPSSKLCSICNTKQEAMPLNIRKWTCSCGKVHDRDINASINILNEGLRILNS
jgi:putative transposase